MIGLAFDFGVLALFVLKSGASSHLITHIVIILKRHEELEDRDIGSLLETWR
jgi:hypothetical protein